MTLCTKKHFFFWHTYVQEKKLIQLESYLLKRNLLELKNRKIPAYMLFELTMVSELTLLLETTVTSNPLCRIDYKCNVAEFFRINVFL